MTQDTEKTEYFPEPKAASWGQERRLQFIDFRLRWEGRINRTDLTEYFGISVPQASIDIAKYLELAPDNTQYDKSSKTYTVGANFKALYQRSSAQRYLAELLATKAGIIDKSGTFIGVAPDMDWPMPPWRTVNEQTVEAVVTAIREKTTVMVSYQSMSSSDASPRIISPHALGNDGFRWHVRAYCHRRERFSDFLLARILSIEPGDPSPINPAEDAVWATVLSLVLAPNPGLPPEKRRVIELDYGMKDGHAVLQCRQALLYYTLRRLGLHTTSADDPVAQQIFLMNRDELQPFIDAIQS